MLTSVAPRVEGNCFGLEIQSARSGPRCEGAKDVGANNQRLYLNGARVAEMSDTQPIDLNSAALGIGRHVSDIADPFNGCIDAFRISHFQRSDGWMGPPGTT